VRFFYVGGGLNATINVPDGADLAPWMTRLAPGDTLRLAENGSYTTALTGMASGTSGGPITIDSNGATITGQTYGISLTDESYITIRNLHLRNQTIACVLAQASNNIHLYDCTFKSVGTPTFIDVTKIRNCSEFWFHDCTCLESEGVTTCDGFEFWDCTDSGCIDCHAEGFHNGPLEIDNGHAFEVYGESASETCTGIVFLRCTADDCRAGFTAESPNGDAPHEVTCTDCAATNMDFFGYHCESPCTMTLVNCTGTTGGTGTFN
jgi:hypothetical protein